MLLSGVDNYLNGLFDKLVFAVPYEGTLNHDVATIAELLSPALALRISEQHKCDAACWKFYTRGVSFVSTQRRSEVCRQPAWREVDEQPVLAEMHFWKHPKAKTDQ